MSNKAWSLVKDALQVIVFALILTLLIRSFIFETRTIPSGSMLPTLQIGDKLFIDKIVFKFTKLERLDIVTFEPPPEAQTGNSAASPWIKRIIGMPGDNIAVSKGEVILNGKPLNEPFVTQKPIYTMEERTVPDGAVFVMGDNRNNSNDSHFWGFLPVQNIQGKAFYRYWPPKRIGPLDP